jgi:hypothetical protein
VVKTIGFRVRLPGMNGCYKHCRLGRKHPDKPLHGLRFNNYKRDALPSPPAGVDYSPLAQASLRNMYDNDSLGDCVVAAGFHVRGTGSGNATGGNPVVFSNAQTIAEYSALSGYVPGDPNTDNGVNEQDALKYWSSTGFPDGVKLSGWVSVDPTRQQEIMQAIDLFENLVFGVPMPDEWIGISMPQADGFVWDVASEPNPNNGHAFNAVGYNTLGVQIDTWAMIGTITWAAIAKYCAQSVGGELYCLLSPDIINKASGKSPLGIDWTTLQADLQSLGGSPVPTPVVPPLPVPVPPVPPLPIPGQWQSLISYIESFVTGFGPPPAGVLAEIQAILGLLNPQPAPAKVVPWALIIQAAIPLIEQILAYYAKNKPVIPPAVSLEDLKDLVQSL